METTPQNHMADKPRNKVVAHPSPLSRKDPPPCLAWHTPGGSAPGGRVRRFLGLALYGLVLDDDGITGEKKLGDTI